MVRCHSCGCMVREERRDCPYCGAILPATTGQFFEGSRPTMPIVEERKKTSDNRKILGELRRAYIQRLILTILLTGVLIINVLTLIVLVSQ